MEDAVEYEESTGSTLTPVDPDDAVAVDGAQDVVV